MLNSAIFSQNTYIYEVSDILINKNKKLRRSGENETICEGCWFLGEQDRWFKANVNQTQFGFLTTVKLNVNLLMYLITLSPLKMQSLTDQEYFCFFFSDESMLNAFMIFFLNYLVFINIYILNQRCVKLSFPSNFFVHDTFRFFREEMPLTLVYSFFLRQMTISSH